MGTGPLLSGDFDSDGDVDGADFLTWQQGFGGAYGASDLTDWENNFGSTGAAIAAAGAVPEPSSCVLLLMATVGLAFVRQRANISFVC